MKRLTISSQESPTDDLVKIKPAEDSVKIEPNDEVSSTSAVESSASESSDEEVSYFNIAVVFLYHSQKSGVVMLSFPDSSDTKFYSAAFQCPMELKKWYKVKKYEDFGDILLIKEVEPREINIKLPGVPIDDITAKNLREDLVASSISEGEREQYSNDLSCMFLKIIRRTEEKRRRYTVVNHNNKEFELYVSGKSAKSLLLSTCFFAPFVSSSDPSLLRVSKSELFPLKGFKAEYAAFNKPAFMRTFEQMRENTSEYQERTIQDVNNIASYLQNDIEYLSQIFRTVPKIYSLIKGVKFQNDSFHKLNSDPIGSSYEGEREYCTGVSSEVYTPGGTPYRKNNYGQFIPVSSIERLY